MWLRQGRRGPGEARGHERGRQGGQKAFVFPSEKGTGRTAVGGGTWVPLAAGERGEGSRSGTWGGTEVQHVRKTQISEAEGLIPVPGPLPWGKGLWRPLCTESVVHTDHPTKKAVNGVLLANGPQVSAPTWPEMPLLPPPGPPLPRPRL